MVLSELLCTGVGIIEFCIYEAERYECQGEDCLHCETMGFGKKIPADLILKVITSQVCETHFLNRRGG